MSEDELATLRSVPSDPPDLVVTTTEFGQITIEITESVPYDRDSEAKSKYFIHRLRTCLSKLGTKSPKLSNLAIHRERFAFPSITSDEVKSIAGQIDGFFKGKDFKAKYKKIQKVIESPISITYIPALGTFAYPVEFYENNLFVHDITGYPVERKETENSFGEIIQKKKGRAKTADILLIFHGTHGIIGLDEALLNLVRGKLLSGLTHEGIYMIEIIEFNVDYWINVLTIREHPIFQLDFLKV